MSRVARFLLSCSFVFACAGCLSYPEAITLEERDASVMPERPAQPIAIASDAGPDATSDAADASHPNPDRDASASPPPPPPPPPDDTKPCDACPPGTKCCPKGAKGKGKGNGGKDDVEIVCKPPQADCD